MTRAMGLFCAGLFTVLSTQGAGAGEICGNKLDDDGNNMTDEGCYPAMRTGVCESPLSCADTGWVSWSTGSLHYDLPPDVAPQSPYGPDIALRRFYTSLYSPPSTPSSVNRTPLGSRWQHNYMSWIDAAAGGGFVIHTPQGEDLYAYPGAEGDMSFHALQAGRGRYAWLRERWNASLGATEYELATNSGEALIYNSAGQLGEIRDTVAAPNTNKVRLTWTGTGNGSAVRTVTDATGKRRLLFNYTSNLLTSVNFQLFISNNWTTFHTTAYAYTAGALTSVTIGGQLAQTNVYTGGALTQIKDGGNKQIVAFKYSAVKPGETSLVDTDDGTLGFEFDSTRSACSSQTVLYFNKGNDNSCSTDGDCGSGYLCGGKTGPGATGTCFRGARCLTIDPDSNEGLVTSVSALGPGSEPCTGACAEVTQYVWNTAGFGALDLEATGDAIGSFTTASYAHGMPTKIAYADNDADPDNGGGARTVYLFYDGDHPGRLTEIRRPSRDTGQGGCNETYVSGCARTLYEYDPSTGKLAQTTNLGYTLDGAGDAVTFSYTTAYTYDSRGRLTAVDGPLNGPGDDDVTRYTYHASGDPLTDGFLRSYAIGTSAWALTQYVNQYDYWGNATDWLDVDGTRSCRTYDPARNYLTRTSEEMSAANSDCASDDPSDIVERFVRDSALRPIRDQAGDGSCLLYEYDAKGRLARTKRRDDCNASSPGDREEYVYDSDGLLTEVDTYNGAGAVTRKTLSAYHDSRRLQAIMNPVDTTKLMAFSYDERGTPFEVNAEGGLGRTSVIVDADYRPTSLTRARTATTNDHWTFESDRAGELVLVTDPDGKNLQTTYDDLGRLVRQVSPDQGTTPFHRSYTPRGRIETSTDTETRTFTYDSLGRLLTADWPGKCNASSPPEIQNYWDRTTLLSDPLLIGRLAATRVTLMCDSLLSGGALDQWTHYSYDAAGRVVAEDISDNDDRVANQTYTWTKGDSLSQVTLPSSTVLGWTYGSTGSTASNSDTDLVTALWRTSPDTPVIDNVSWNPYGPLKQYNRMDVISGSPLRMRLEYNQAYRPTEVTLEGQTFGGPYYRLRLAEDAKGRITQRDYYPSHPQMTGVFDSYFLYDHQDRVVCETTSPVTTCPTSVDNLKNSHPASFTGAGDRKTLLRPIPGSGGGMTHLFGLASGTHRISSVNQSDGGTVLGTTIYNYDARGNRTRDDNPGALTPADRRVYTYDGRNNLSSVRGTYAAGFEWHDYVLHSAFDGKNRRVFKAFEDLVTHKQKRWFFYYDPLDRLTEVRYIPDASVPSTFTTYQLFWLGQLLTAYWQTDSPSGVTSKRYVEFDETGRPVRMHSWEAGNSRVVWAINPDAWGMDTTVIGPGMYQPILFAGQYQDAETACFLSDGVTINRPGLVLNGFRTYDPFTGSYLQLDPLVKDTWSAYAYADGNPVGKKDPTGLESKICRQVKGGSEWIRNRDGWLDEVIIMVEECWDTGPDGHTGGLGGAGGGSGSSAGGSASGSKGSKKAPVPPKAPKPWPVPVDLNTTTCSQDIGWLLSSDRPEDPYFWSLQREWRAAAALFWESPSTIVGKAWLEGGEGKTRWELFFPDGMPRYDLSRVFRAMNEPCVRAKSLRQEASQHGY